MTISPDDFRVAQYDRYLAQVAADLHDFADSVAHLGRPGRDQTGESYVFAAQRVLSGLHNLLPNLPLTLLLKSAADIQVFQAVQAAERAATAVADGSTPGPSDPAGNNSVNA